jgi:hypothetical protein
MNTFPKGLEAEMALSSGPAQCLGVGTWHQLFHLSLFTRLPARATPCHAAHTPVLPHELKLLILFLPLRFRPPGTFL